MAPLPPKYPPAVMREILDHIDANKGRSDGLRMLPELANNLNLKFAPAMKPVYNPSGLESRLRRVIENHACEDRFRSLPNLWKLGTDILDLAKFKPEGTYTNAEISTNLEIDTTFFESAEDAESLVDADIISILIQVLDQNKGESGLFTTDLGEAYKLALQELQKQLPADALREISLEDIQRKYNQLARKAYGMSSSSRTQLGRRRYMYREGKASLDLRRFKGIFDQEEIDAWWASITRRDSDKKRRVTRGAGASSAGPPASKRPRIDESSSEDSELSDDDADIVISSSPQQALEVQSASFAPNFRKPDTKFVTDALSSIFRSIKKAVGRHLRATDIDRMQPFIFDEVQLNGLDEQTTQLLENLLSSDRSQLRAKYQHFDTVRAVNHLSIESAIQSIIGVALTTWVFYPNLESKFKSREANVMLSVLRSEYAEFAKGFKVRALDACFKEHVKREAPRHAERLATLLQRFMPLPVDNEEISFGFRHPPSAWEDFSENVQRYIPSAETSASTSTPPVALADSTRRSLRLRMPKDLDGFEPVRALRDQLTEVFEKAMKLKIQMAWTDGSFIFVFPYPGEIIHEAESDGSQKLFTRQKYVQLGILPSVHWKPKTSDERLGQRVPCAPYSAHIYYPPVQR